MPVVVLVRPRAVVRELSHPRRVLAVVRDHHPRVAVRAEVLAGIEAEARRVAERPRAAAADRSTVRLRRVLEHGDAASGRDGVDRGHVRRMPVEVHGQDHLGLGGDRGLELRGVHGEGLRIDVDEHRPRAVQQDRLAGGDEGVGDGDHLVLGADPVGLQGQGEGVGAVGHPDRVGGPAPGRELGLEQAAVLALDEVAALDDARDGGVDLGLDAAVLGPEIDHGNGGGRAHRAIVGEPLGRP